MTAILKATLPLVALLAVAGSAAAQDAAADVKAKAQQTLENARETAGAVSESIDTNPQAQEASAGILKPIYQLAEAFSFPAFHWLAFAVMVAGAVSFALQLTLGKLMVLARLSFSLSEVLSDALGLVVSLVGLVLTTQAAAENSDFTKSAAAVLSATAAGAVTGFVFYLWGQRQELQAVEGRKKVVAAKAVEPSK
jgi:ABC-type multidrug transport system fused ATPase/permease subunit